MRRVVLILILALAACSESTEISSTGLEPADASLIAVFKTAADDVAQCQLVPGNVV